MIKNEYPFGATFDKHMYNDIDTREQWANLFNYAVPANELKWKANEKVEGQLDFEYGDLMRDLFKSWDVPFRGHTLFWGVADRTPSWFEQSPTKEAMIKRVIDAASRYEGEVTGWDVFNEVLHDGDFFIKHFGEDIFAEMIGQYRIQNPTGKAAINDYNVLRADKGRCFLDRMDGLDLDALGLQRSILTII